MRCYCCCCCCCCQGDDDYAPSQEGVPTSYQAVDLIDALNGPQRQGNTHTYTQTLPATIPRQYMHTSSCSLVQHQSCPAAYISMSYMSAY